MQGTWKERWSASAFNSLLLGSGVPSIRWIPML